jgi:hypothetical protein
VSLPTPCIRDKNRLNVEEMHAHAACQAEIAAITWKQVRKNNLPPPASTLVGLAATGQTVVQATGINEYSSRVFADSKAVSH